jgi:hypothetical protein
MRRLIFGALVAATGLVIGSLPVAAHPAAPAQTGQDRLTVFEIMGDTG